MSERIGGADRVSRMAASGGQARMFMDGLPCQAEGMARPGGTVIGEALVQPTLPPRVGGGTTERPVG
jgi:hypothetical protein